MCISYGYFPHNVIIRHLVIKKVFGSCPATGKIMCTISFDVWAKMNAGLQGVEINTKLQINYEIAVLT